MPKLAEQDNRRGGDAATYDPSAAFWDAADRRVGPKMRATFRSRTGDVRGKSHECRYCRRRQYRYGKSCGRRDCPGFISVWLGDQRVRLWDNLRAFDGDVIMTSITAPSMPWDTTKCSAAPGHRCSGKLGCVVEAEPAMWWNLKAELVFRDLHKAAYQATYRRFGGGALKRLAYCPELQSRGMLHWHVVLGYGSTVQRSAADYYVGQLAQLAPHYGFGYVDRGRKGPGGVRRLESRPSWQAAAYLSKYFTSETKGGIGELILRQEAPSRPVYVSRELTADTRTTMRNLRRRRAVWCLWKVRVPCAEAEVLWQLLSVFNGTVYDQIAEGDPPAPAPPAAVTSSSA